LVQVVGLPPLRTPHPTGTAKGCRGASSNILVIALAGHNIWFATGKIGPFTLMEFFNKTRFPLRTRFGFMLCLVFQDLILVFVTLFIIV
jgi:hypothetical protein